MWNYLLSFAGQPPLPPPVTITGIRFPADGSKPHILSLTTTTHGVRDGPDCFLRHIPDFRSFWTTQQAWRQRDLEMLRLKNQRLSSCDGLYFLFYSFDFDSLPENGNVPKAVCGMQRTFAGDAFVVRQKCNENGDEILGEDGWAIWEDVPEGILSLPVMKT